MAENTKEVRTIMFSVEKNGVVVTHRLPFNANEVYGRSKLEKLLKRGFTYDDPRAKDRTGLPQVIITQEVDLSKPIVGDGPVETATETLVPPGPTVISDEVPIKNWRDMNARERRSYQNNKKHLESAKKGGANA